MSLGISYKAVTRRYGASLALDRIDVEIAPGEFVALLGPSGCGKTTLLRITADLDQPTGGTVLVGGAPPAVARRKRQLGLVSQRPAVLPWKRAVNDVRFTQVVARKAGPDAATLLADFGLGADLEKRPHELSGGMLQRVNFASAIAHDPDVLLMDEPFSALDEMRREELGQWLDSALSARPRTALLVTHSVDEAVSLADRVLVFSPAPGRILADLRIPAPRPRPPSFRAEPAFVSLAATIRTILSGALGQAA